MSAIFGIYSTNGQPVTEADLGRMSVSLAHRGPDGSGVWIGHAVGLGHQMLCATPESLKERLPYESENGELVIVSDSRIDNRDELIPALDNESRSSAGIGDTELILRAYRKWGEACPERLCGDFSFAIWDLQKQQLFCARDPIGIKPFYYYHRPGQIFVFASEIKALLTLSTVPRQVNEVRIAQYLLSELKDERITFYQDIWRLPAGHAMTVTPNRSWSRSYWSLDPSKELPQRSDEVFADGFRELLTEAVRCRIRCPYRVGAMLSGGLDSSTIVSITRQLLSEQPSPNLETFSAVFDQVPECDERNFINAVIARGGLKPHFIRGDNLSPLMDADRVFWHEDEPFYAPNLFLHWNLYSAAREQGVRVLLDGFDGDVVVSHGLRHLAELARGWHWIRLASEAIKLSRQSRCSFWNVIRSQVISPLAPRSLRHARRSLRQFMRVEQRATEVLNPAFAHRIGPMIVENGPLAAHTSREFHHGELTSGLIPF